MLKCEDYIMFEGVMKITPNSSKFNKLCDNSYGVSGVWLYKPDVDCWYCDGKSYPSNICQIAVDNTR